MTEYLVTAPDGKKFKINTPAGASQKQAFAFADSQFKKMKLGAQTPPSPPPPPSPINAGDASMGAGLVSGLGGAALGTAQLVGQALTPSPSEPAPLQFISKTLADIGGAQGISGPTLTTGAQRGLDFLASQTQPYKQAHPELYGAGDIGGQIAAAMGPEGVSGDIAAARGLIGRFGQTIRGGLTAGAEQPPRIVSNRNLPINPRAGFDNSSNTFRCHGCGDLTSNIPPHRRIQECACL